MQKKCSRAEVDQPCSSGRCADDEVQQGTWSTAVQMKCRRADEVQAVQMYYSSADEDEVQQRR